MSQYVFMNHRIRMPEPDGPVIVVQDAEGEQREADDWEIFYRGQPIGRVTFTRKGLDAVETHSVHAWVEFADDVELRAVAEASAKRPKRPVKTTVEKAFDLARKK